MAIETDKSLTQWIVEVPPIVPRIVQLTTHRNHCTACGQSVSSSHPLQVSGASGSASTHLGPRADDRNALLTRIKAEPRSTPMK
ncbi:MAG: hypothetical protein KDG54_17195, partial [Geminicoccaceae bacterium]|nr:hypothetical protein [Geminicoccaceae bacterium]